MSDKLIKGKQMIIFTIACVLLVSQLVGCAEQNKKPEKSDSVVGINSIEESVDLEKPEDNEATIEENQHQEELAEKIEFEKKEEEEKNTQRENNEEIIEPIRPASQVNNLEKNNKPTQSNTLVETTEGTTEDEETEYYYGKPAKKLSPSYEAALDELGYEPFEKELVRLLIQDSGLTFKEAVEDVRSSYVPTLEDLEPFQGEIDEAVTTSDLLWPEDLDPLQYASVKKLAPEYEAALMSPNISEYQRGKIRFLVQEEGLSFEVAVTTVFPGAQIIYKVQEN